MRRRTDRFLGATVLAAVLATCGPAPAVSRHTALAADGCRVPAVADRQTFDSALGVQECDSIDGWRVFFVSSNEHSWIELRRGGVSWSAERAIVYDAPIGLFPGVDDTVPLEWRVKGDGTAVALLVVVRAQNPQDDAAAVSRRFVVRLGPQGACLLGREPSADDAERLADSTLQCD